MRSILGTLLMSIILTTAGYASSPIVGSEAHGHGTVHSVEFGPFTAGGHVFGFDRTGYHVSNGTYALHVSFEHAQPIRPTIDGTAPGSSDAKAPALGRVS